MRLFGLLALSALLSLIVGCEAWSHAPTPIPTKNLGLNGQSLYESQCAVCHGMNGEGYKAELATQLSNPNFLAGASDRYLFEATAIGRLPSKMGPWSAKYAGNLTDAQITAIARYMRHWQTLPALDIDKEKVAGAAEQGARLYAANCAVCHGDKGQGHAGDVPANTGISLNTPGFLQVASDGFIRYTIAKGRLPTQMESWEGKLTPQEINDLTSYIRSWDK